MKRIFKTRHFNRWSKKIKLSDASLIEAINEIEQGLVDAVLASGLIKKRVAVGGQGKRGGARVILARKIDSKWFFLHGFMKNERENINTEELAALSEIAECLMELSNYQINSSIEKGVLVEVKYD